jgi:hypothetical protein
MNSLINTLLFELGRIAVDKYPGEEMTVLTSILENGEFKDLFEELGIPCDMNRMVHLAVIASWYKIFSAGVTHYQGEKECSS